ncbi:uncharacterized protein [Miscanthus floridulus]|uniref:uncharacterized protein n=1 Tax=Miscanthus floridulus TaxID=154761 RepID=UPI003459FFB1
MSSPEFPGGGGEDTSGPAITRPGAEADAPEAWALGKRAVSSVGSTAEVEQATAGAAQPPLRMVEEAPVSDEGRPAPADTEAVPPPPPPPLQRRDAVLKRLCPRLSQKHQAEVPTLAPHKALKVSTGSSTKWVVEAQAAIQRGAVSARTDPKEPVAQGEATEVATEQAEEEEPMPRKAKAHESDEVGEPSVAEATEANAEALRTSEAEATEVEALRASEAKAAGAGAPRATKVEAAEASLGMVEPAG